MRGYDDQIARGGRGHRLAMVAVGVLVPMTMAVAPSFAEEIPVPQTYDDAMAWYEEAARAGDARAQYLLAIQFEHGVTRSKDLAAAAHWYGEAAAQGHEDAQLGLAAMYFTGRGVARDYAAAAGWYRRAADQGSAIAAYNLGLMAERGLGVDRDEVRAAQRFEQAAVDGVLPARTALAVLYARGIDGVPDLVRAKMWMLLAEEGGQAITGGLNERLIAALDPAQAAEAERLAEAWLAGEAPSTAAEGSAASSP